MITATDLELRAGARILLEPTTLRVQPGDRIGLVGRNGAGKTTTLRTFAGETLPHAGRSSGPARSATCRRIRAPATSSVLARDRVLSARGLDTLVTDIAKVQLQLAERPDDATLMRRYGALEDRFTALGGYAAESEAARICANLGLARPGAAPAAAHPVRWPAAPGRAGPHPVRRLRRRTDHVAARRADQPPRRRLDRLAARLPAPAHRRPGADQPRRRTAGRGGQQGLVPRRQPRRARRLQRRLEDLPAAARDRRATPAPRAGQRRTQDRVAAHPGRQDAGQGDQGPGRASDGPPGSRTGGRPGRGARRTTRWRGCASRHRRRAGGPR